MKTLKQWNKRNRLIITGSKAKGFTKTGKALFKKKQTTKMKAYFPDDWDWYRDSYDDTIDFDECDEYLWLNPLNQ